MAKDPVLEIAALLRSDVPEKRVAAAVVLGEIGARAKEVVEGLVAMLESGSPPVQKPALDALVKIGAKSAVSALLPLLSSRDAEVRARTVDALEACGDDVVPKLRARIALAQGDERKALDAVLARFGDTKDAVHTLLVGLESSDPEVARAVALEIRPKIKEADGKTRRMWLAELQKVIERMRKVPPVSPIPFATAVKILGYLEDDKSVDILLDLAKAPKTPFAVKQEALIALRWAISDDARGGEVVDALVDAAEATDRMLAQAAIMGLAAVDLPKKHAGRLARLAAHADPERARIAIEKLTRVPGIEVTRALVDVVAKLDRRRGEAALKALETREDAGPLVLERFVDEKDADRASTLRVALKPHLRTLTPAQRKKLVVAALDRLDEEAAWQAHVDIAREADGKALAAGIRDRLEKIGKKKSGEALVRTLLALLSKSEHGTDEDRYRLASLLLRESAMDTRPAARENDEALALLERLATSNAFDLSSALRKDRGLEPEHLYYVAFHFAEEKAPIGAELLAEVVKNAGRTKIGKMAKNKLALFSSADA